MNKLKNKIIAYKNFQKALSLFLILILFTFLSGNNLSFAQETPKIRELGSDFLDINETIIDSENDLIYTNDTVLENNQKYREEDEKEIINAPVLKGGISELRATVGKSQIIRFDEPVKRISITKPDLVDMIFLTPREIIMNGKKGGETTVIIWGEDKDPVFFNLFVENNNLNFIKEVKKIAPGEDIEIDFIDTGTDSGLKVVLKGQLSSSIIKSQIDKVAQAYGYSIVDLTETLEPQVKLEVKIVEISKSKGKSRGFEVKKGLFDYLDLAESASGHTLNLTDGGNTYTDPWFKDAAWEALVESTSALAGTTPIGIDDFGGNASGMSFADGVFSNWRVYPNSNLAMRLNMAESEGLIKVLSEPSVMVVNGQAANFTSGSEVPIPSGVDELGNQQYEYTNVGTTINITPQILEKAERILLDISAQVSEIDSSISTTAGPGFNTRNGKTKVEIANNQTTVITGLVRKSESKTRDKFPFLSNLPLIGELFDSVTASSDETELMIFITASIIKPDLAKGG